MAENILYRMRSATSAAGGYRGPDRRRKTTTVPTSRAFSIGVPLFLILSHLAALLAARYGLSLTDTGNATDWLTATVAVVTALAAAMYLMRWRLTGDAPALWIGAGLMVYSGANIAFPGLVRSFASVDSDARSWAGLLRPASVFVVVGLLLVAAVAPAVSARLRPSRVALFAVAAALVGMLASAWSTDVQLVLGPALDQPPADGLGAFGQVGVALLWLGLATAFMFPPFGERPRAPWIGVMLLGLAEARLALAVSINGNEGWMLASQLFRLFSVVAALGGAFHELQRAFSLQRANLLESLVELATAREEQRVAEATAEERAHDLRSALAGIGGAALTLERYHSRLSDEERASLASAVAAEITRLQQIVADVRPTPESFDLQRVVEPVVVCSQPDDALIVVDIPDGLTAIGRPAEVAEAVQSLLDNARRHAPGCAIAVRGRRRGAHVELRVEDTGPGILPEYRERVFQRGWRGNARTSGSGLGLFSARKLAQEQQGSLWVEDRTGGGAAFVLALPGGALVEDAR